MKPLLLIWLREKNNTGYLNTNSYKQKQNNMGLNKKHLASMIVGTGARVINNDINTAIKIWKQDLKRSKNIERLHELQEYEKPSVRRRRQILNAIYREQFR